MTGIFRGSGSTSTATEEFNIDGDKGDIVVTNSGDTWTIDAGVVTTTKLGGDITTAGKALLDDADASAQRSTLGLGTLAVQNGTFSGTSSGTNTGDQNLFQTIAVSGQSDIVADSTTDTLNLVAGLYVSITTDPITDSITISSASPSGVPDGDKGDIVVSTSGTVWTIDNDVVTYAKIQDVSATDKLLGRSTAGSGNVEEIDCTAAGRALLDDVDNTAQRTTLGLGGASVLNVGTTAGTVAAGDDSRINNGQTAFGWGDHAIVGYLKPADIGVAVQAYDVELDTWATKTAPTGVVVGDTDTQTLTNKTLTSPVISSISNTGTITLPTTSDTLVGRTTTDTLTNKTLTNPTVTNYVESVVAVGTVGSTSTLSLTSGTIQTATLTSATPCTFTMPTNVAGKSFVLLLKQPSAGSATTATFTNVNWGSAGAPTITATLGKMDILTFIADGINWYGSYNQGYTP